MLVPYNLKTEFMNNPIGFTSQRPQLSWNNLHIEVEIPINTEARILLPVDKPEMVIEATKECTIVKMPDGVGCVIGSGIYSFMIASMHIN